MRKNKIIVVKILAIIIFTCSAPFLFAEGLAKNPRSPFVFLGMFWSLILFFSYMMDNKKTKNAF